MRESRQPASDDRGGAASPASKPARTLTWDPDRLPAAVASGLVGPGAPFEMRDEDVRGTPCPCFVRRPHNVRDALRRSAQERGDLDYLVLPERTLSFAATAAAAGHVARRLHDDFGVRPGDRVAIAAANSLGHAVAWWAIVSSGAVAAGLNGWWARPELAHGIELTSPRLVLADAKRRDRLLDAPLPSGMQLVDLDELLVDALDQLDRTHKDAATGEPPEMVDVDRTASPHGPTRGDNGDGWPEVTIDEDDPLTILFTSGTTGRPKGAVISHRNVAHVIMAVGLGGAITALTAEPSLPPVEGQPTTILASPLFHVSGLLPLAVGAFFGTKLVFPPPGPWDETSHLELSQRHGVTTWSGVPTQLWRLLEHPDLGRYDLSRLRSFGGGGAMFPPELRRLAATKLPGVLMGTGYGMTETFGSGTRLSATVAETHPASVGMVEPGNEIRIIGPHGEPLAKGEVGEVCIRGAAVFLGYWGDPDATKAVLDEDRWYRTGDFGRIEGDVLYLESRMRDLIIRGGENVYPIEIENRLVAHPDIEDACVIGVDHVQLGQEVATVVVPRSGATLTVDAVRDWAAAALAPFKVPAYVLLRPSLPYTQTGKLLKHQVEADVRQELKR